MSQLNVTTLKHESAGVDNLVLDSSGNATFGGVAKVGGLMNPSGSASAIAMDSAGRVTMPYQPFVSGGRSAGDVSNGIYIFNDLNFNRGNHYNTSTGYFTCPVAGVYAIHFSVMTSPSYSGDQDAFSIAINGTNLRNHYRSSTGHNHQRIDGLLLYYCSANDAISFVARTPQIYGGSKTHSYGNIWLVG